MPGDIFVFIAGAGSFLQVLIIDCSTSTREPVYEPPFTLPRIPYPIPRSWTQAVWVGDGDTDGATCGTLCQPQRLLSSCCCLLGGRSWDRAAKTYLQLYEVPPLHIGRLLQQPSPGLMDSQTTGEACPALSMAQSFRVGSKNPLTPSKRTGAISCFLQDFPLAAPRKRCRKDEIQNLSWDLSHLMAIG